MGHQGVRNERRRDRHKLYHEKVLGGGQEKLVTCRSPAYMETHIARSSS